ncbi:dihydrodipicolinate synthase family protein [Salirhabdus salicampi]|uniref:dihydrodipicolinate synthase family protein n=1 Tax=Salirhabdus salicampi TaxID=476102 RepID=UPI0020C5465E|nr:dihydrodipicolinate synthase family protein [Salirhabdus salicampi]MCP8615255.1 dihydrodipicolinate synthase family protein [Salirhabdus salicampi]
MGNRYKLFTGIIPPVVTLFDQNGDIDWKLNFQLTDWLINKGVHGILFLGSTGEFSAMTIEERKLFTREMTQYVNKRVPVIIGSGTTSLKETIELSQSAESFGADGVMVVSPFYWNYTEDQLFEYFKTVANNLSISVLLYNIPLLTGQSLSSDLITRLANTCENIIGVKDTIDSISHIREVILGIQKIRKDFSVFSAFDEHMYPSLVLGAAGSINGSAVFAPELSVKLYESFQKNNYSQAIQLHQKIVKLMDIYKFSTPFFLGVKEAVQQRVLKCQTSHRITVDNEDLKEKVNRYLISNGLN